MSRNPDQPNTAAAGGYGGDPLQEAVRRLTRIETRVTALGRMLGYRPGDETPQPGVEVRVADGVIYVSSVAATVGQIMAAASRERHGLYTVVVCGQDWGTIEVK